MDKKQLDHTLQISMSLYGVKKMQIWIKKQLDHTFKFQWVFINNVLVYHLNLRHLSMIVHRVFLYPHIYTVYPHVGCERTEIPLKLVQKSKTFIIFHLHMWERKIEFNFSPTRKYIYSSIYVSSEVPSSVFLSAEVPTSVFLSAEVPTSVFLSAEVPSSVYSCAQK